jgi:uncharacterized protein
VRGGPSLPVRGGPSLPVRGGPSLPVRGGPSLPVRGGPSLPAVGRGAAPTARCPPPRAASVPRVRVLALADEPPHGPIPELVAASRPELIVLLGDLEPAWTDGLADVELPKLGVLGNHDAADALQAVGAEEVHLRRVEAGGLSFSGFGGSPRYTEQGRNQWTEEEAAGLLERLPPADVLLTHSPPAGVNDDSSDPVHRGSPALRDWVERHRPAWLLHGHTLPDPARRVHRLGETRVVHVRGATALDLQRLP